MCWCEVCGKLCERSGMRGSVAASPDKIRKRFALGFPAFGPLPDLIILTQHLGISHHNNTPADEPCKAEHGPTRDSFVRHADILDRQIYDHCWSRDQPVGQLISGLTEFLWSYARTSQRLSERRSRRSLYWLDYVLHLDVIYISSGCFVTWQQKPHPSTSWMLNHSATYMYGCMHTYMLRQQT